MTFLRLFIGGLAVSQPGASSDDTIILLMAFLYEILPPAGSGLAGF